MSEDVQEIRTRLATVADSAALAELAARLFRQTYERAVPAADLDAFLAAGFNAGQLRGELADPSARTLLVESEGRAIGYAQVRRRRLTTAGAIPRAEAELARLYLDRPWHGRGVAQVVLARVADLALDLGADFIWLGVWEHNGRAVAFYEKHGFRPVGMQEFQLGDELHHDRVMVAKVSALAGAGRRRPDEGWQVPAR